MTLGTLPLTFKDCQLKKGDGNLATYLTVLVWEKSICGRGEDHAEHVKEACGKHKCEEENEGLKSDFWLFSATLNNVCSFYVT